MIFRMLPIIIGLIVGPLFAYGQTTQSNAPVKEEISGKILDINQDASQIKVRSYENGQDNSYNDEDIYVMQEAKIEVDGKALQLSDLSSGMDVVVSFRISAEGKKEADHIWVKGH